MKNFTEPLSDIDLYDAKKYRDIFINFDLEMYIARKLY